MGTVYKAIQINLNRQVALKVLEPSLGGTTEESMKRFNSEAQAMKKLDHQNIVQVYGFGNNAGQMFIAMTFVPGKTLSEFLDGCRRLDIDDALSIVKQIARGLLYAHGKGIVHRDIKPSNILIQPDNIVKITDFGISHAQDSERLTSTGTAMGTPEYMSPEQCQGEEITEQSDIYSLGIVFYEMVCGTPPFTGNKPLDIAYKQVHNEPEAPQRYNPSIPKAMATVILKCLAKNRSDRFQNMGAFLEELDRVTGRTIDTPTTPKNQLPKVSMISRRGFPEWLFPVSLGLIALLILLQVLLFFLQQEKTSGVQILREFELSAPWEQRGLESDNPDGYPLTNLVDDNLQTAWLLPNNDIQNNHILVIRFPRPTLVLNLGVAVGYQKAKDDNLQDRFSMFQKPQVILVSTVEGSVQRIQLQNIKGMQFPVLQPIETMEIRLDMREILAGSAAENDLALSEIRLVGTSISKE